MEDDKARRALDTTVDTSVAFAIAGPAGAVPVLLSAIARNTIGEFLSRQLSAGERARTERVADQIKHVLEVRLSRGEQPRDDGFFDSDRDDAVGGIDRAAAAEILEGALLKCQREHEQKKDQFIANIWANAVFDTISLEFLNRLLRIAEQLTYRQLVITALLGSERSRRPRDEIHGARELKARRVSAETLALIQELVDLQSVGVLVAEPPVPSRSDRPEASWIINPSLSEIGKQLCELMGLLGSRGLDGIPESDLDRLKNMILDLWNRSLRPSRNEGGVMRRATGARRP